MMFSNIKMMVVFVAFIIVAFSTATVSITIVHSAVISPAKCFPAESKWISTGSCTHDADGWCSGTISWQHHIVSYNCDTTEAGTCTETEVTFTSYPDTHTTPCPSQWTPSSVPCPFPNLNTNDLPSQVFTYPSCY
jgi:hypothetical protein